MRNRLSQLAAIAAWALVACTDSSGTTVELQGIVAPDQACNYQASNPIAPSGYYDPIADPLNRGYQMAAVALNNMEAATDESYTYGSTNIHWRTRDAIITGWEACWDSDPNDFTPYTKQQDITKGPVLDCAALAKAGKGFTLPASVALQEGGLAQVMVGTYVMTPQHLKTLFGADFDARAIPLGYAYTLDGNQYYGQGANAADPARSPAWGTFPSSGSADVLVQARVRWTTQGGLQGVSNWIMFPMTICPGCIEDACGPLTHGACYFCQPDGGGCDTANKCLSDSTVTCTLGQGYTGIKPQYGAAGTTACHPEEGWAQLNCTTARTYDCNPK